MHFEFLVEEPSAEVALQNLLPVILGHTDFAIHPSQGKADFLKNLPGRLKPDLCTAAGVLPKLN